MTLGSIICIVASAVNFFVARAMFNASKTYNSIALKADSHHLMTDVYTSAGVLIGVALVYITGFKSFSWTY